MGMVNRDSLRRDIAIILFSRPLSRGIKRYVLCGPRRDFKNLFSAGIGCGVLGDILFATKCRLLCAFIFTCVVTCNLYFVLSLWLIVCDC